MNKIILSSADVEYILQWRDAHKDLVRMNNQPMKAIKMFFPEVKIIVTAVAKDDFTHFSITQGGKSLGSFDMKYLFCGMVETTARTIMLLSSEDVQSVITTYTTLMAMFVFGAETVPEEDTPKKSATHKMQKRKPQQNQKMQYTYVLKRSSNGAYLAPKSSHRSPNHAFSVRGHYRHYKNGNVIWIEEFKKGTGKNKSKKYKLRGGSNASKS